MMMQMQSISSFSSSNAFYPLPTALPRLSLPFRAFGSLSSIKPPFSSLATPRKQVPFTPLHSTATQEVIETSKDALGFVDIGYISNVHGLQGEICVKPSTDFPELRFSTPGRRWLKQKVLSEETIQEIELEEGREHPGQKSWILKFRGIDTVEQAKMLIGGTLLVTDEDRPEIEEGEFYSHDLVGMRVFMKESGELVGTVINIFNSGAHDLLQVQLDSSFDILDNSDKPRSAETEASGHLAWVPFVEAIVPDVDMERREMHITPPKGLLELNLRFDERSKNERRQLEWKERKRFQKRLIAAKKKLCELDQQHVFHGFRYGKKEQGSLLSHQIVGVNSKLFQVALQSLEQRAKRWNVAELVSALEAKLISSMQISEESLLLKSKYNLIGDDIIQEKGLKLMSEGKMAIVLLLNNIQNDATETSTFSLLQKLLCDHENFVEVEDRHFVPLILVAPAQQVPSLRKLFTNNNHFAFDSEKIWFLEEEKLPVVSALLEGQNKCKILMKSPWEILQSPVGSGGVISLFSTHDVADKLSDMGVEYIEICCPNERYAGGNSLLLGLVNSQEANVGVQISPISADSEKNVDMIFSMHFMKKLTKQINKLQFDAIPKENTFVEKVDKDWVTVTSSGPNSYELSCSIYCSLNACSLDKVCIVEVRE